MHIFQSQKIKSCGSCSGYLVTAAQILSLIYLLAINSWGSTRPSARSCTWVGATPTMNTGWGMRGLRAALLRRTWGYWWIKSWTWATNTRLQPRRATVSWAASRVAWPAGQGRGFCPSAPVWWDPIWSPASSSGALSTGKTWTCWAGPEEGHKNDQRALTPLLWGKAERVGAVQPGEEKALRRPNRSLSVHEGSL